MRSVSFSDDGFGDENGSGILLSFRHAKLKAAGEGRVRILAIECVFFSFFPLPTVLAFFHDQTHTLKQRRKVRRHAERPKGDRESSLYSISG